MNKINWKYLILLILAGEAVFVLPFVLQRIFRATVLDVFQVTNTELGVCFSAYGFTAMVSYLLGGPLADRFPPRKLIAIALWATAFGGIVFATYPGQRVLTILYGYWGVTTIFLFWAPMIKATRILGGSRSQGKAYGILDGGRGLTGALFGVVGVIVFAFLMPEQVQAASLTEQRHAFRFVIYSSIALASIIGVLIWFFLKSDGDQEDHAVAHIKMSDVINVLRMPIVWMLMIIILTAYVGYKITDVVSLYAKEVMLFDEVVSARTGTYLMFIRAFIGFVIGVIADRSKITLWLVISFVITFLGALLFALGVASSFFVIFIVSVFIVATGVYASRALYFAVMKDAHIPLQYTGTVIGLASLAGFTPDIFASIMTGSLLDNNPGEAGHQLVFWVLAGVALLGSFVAILCHLMYGKTAYS